MSRSQYSLLSLGVGCILAGTSLIAFETEILDAWSALLLLIGQTIGIAVGTIMERCRAKVLFQTAPAPVLPSQAVAVVSRAGPLSTTQVGGALRWMSRAFLSL